MSICGQDLDEVFAYQTPKMVVLKDRKLGLLAIGLKVVIFVYIFIWLILYQGKHLAIADVDGVYRVTLQHPTADMCNPDDIECSSNYTSLDKLPYCTQSPDPFVTREGEQGKKRECFMWDNIEAFVDHEQGALFPTRVRRYDQVRGCVPSEANGYSCDGAPWVFLKDDGTPQDHKGEAKPLYDFFVSDIDRFTVMFDHTFRRLGGMQADDHDMAGYWLDCPSADAHISDCTPKSLLCVHGDCPEGARRPGQKEASFFAKGARAMRGRRLLAPAPTVAFNSRGHATFKAAAERAAMAGRTEVTEAGRTLMTLPSGEVGVSIKKGDVFALGTLLGLADSGLDEKGDFDETFRTRGLILVVHIIYENRPKHFLGLQVTPWHTTKPHYTYRVTTRTSYDFQKTKTFDDPREDKRTTRTYNGIRLVVEQSGKIALFEMATFLVTMATALGLMAVSNTLTDMIMLYILQHKEIYKKHKYHHSKDFHPDEGAPPLAKPETKEEAAERLIDAIQAQDPEELLTCYPDFVELIGKKDD